MCEHSSRPDRLFFFKKIINGHFACSSDFTPGLIILPFCRTQLKQEAVVSVQGVPLCSKMEAIVTETISKNASKVPSS